MSIRDANLVQQIKYPCQKRNANETVQPGRRTRKDYSLSSRTHHQIPPFSKLLNDVEAGGRFLIQRRGRAICAMAPPPVESRKVSECVALLRGRPPVLLDEGFGDDLADLIDGEPLTEPPKWDS